METPIRVKSRVTQATATIFYNLSSEVSFVHLSDSLEASHLAQPTFQNRLFQDVCGRSLWAV